MPRPKTVTIEKDGLRGKVLESSVEAWKYNGWTLVENESSESGTEPVAPVEAEEPQVPEAPAEVVNEGGDQ